MNYFRNGFNFFIIALISNTILAESQLKFKYPTSITLSDKNILVVEENGIYICNPDFTTIKRAVKTFSNAEDKISSLEKFSTVILIRRNDFIISLIDYTIYIFNPYGDLLYNGQKLITDYNPTSISLIPISYSIYGIKYMVAYFDSDIKLNILYYQYDNYGRNNMISKIIEENLKQRKCYKSSCYYDSSSYHFNFVNSGLSCVDIKDSSYHFDEYFYLVCFFVAKSSKYEYLEELVFQYDDYGIKLSSKFEHDYISFNPNTITQIKADRNENLNQALVCISVINNNSTCYKCKLYNNKADFYKQIKYQSKC